MGFTMGSLFDGSGGFPLVASMCGITPLWASEIEPYPIAVTRSRFPAVKHLGDITKVNGAEIEPVDIITFGSPCQDLSVAGQRKGLKHEDNGDEETTRSGLFMEAIRIIKEMRGATDGRYPTFAVWENVPGAFSSNKGEDFRIVLEELIKVIEPAVEMPPIQGGKWPYEDCYVGDGWSIAYRTLDAQYWGVPQRRRRIYLVADFRAECAEKILFEREGVRGYFAQGRTPWQGAAEDAEGSTGTADSERNCVGADMYNQVLTGDKAATLSAFSCMTATRNGPSIIEHRRNGDSEQYLFENHSQDARYKGPLDVCPMLPAQLGTGGNNTPLVCKSVYCLQGNGIDRADTANCNGKGWRENESYTLNTIDRPAVAYAIGNGQADNTGLHDIPGALNCMHDQQAVLVAKDPGALAYGVDCRNATEYLEKNGCLQAKSNGGFSYNCNQVVRTEYIVRRLTPTECARLQGFPDEWGHPDKKESFTDEEYKFWLETRNTHATINGRATKEYTKGQMLKWYNKLHTDSTEYKMWGNGIALPNALYVMQGIADALGEE